MDKLYEFGISETDIFSMIDINPDIKYLTGEEIIDMINILKFLNCSDKIIKNIIVSNPFFLNRDKKDVLNLIKKLTELGIKRLDITFDANPWLLNKDNFEIDDFINEKKKENILYDDILDLIDSGMVE